MWHELCDPKYDTMLTPGLHRKTKYVMDDRQKYLCAKRS